MIESEKRFSGRTLQLLCLMITGIMGLLLIAVGPSDPYRLNSWVQNYQIVPCALFLGITLAAPLSRNTVKCLIPGCIMVAWLLVVQNLRLFADEKIVNTSMRWSAYLLAFPFAAALQDGREEKGLDLMEAASIAVSSVLSLCLLFTRRELGWQPGTIGTVYLIGIALSIRAAFRCQKTWGRVGLSLLAAVQLLSLLLTHSRWTIVLGCGFLVGILLFSIIKKKQHKIAACVLAGLVLLGALFIFRSPADASPVQPSGEISGQAEAGLLGSRPQVWKAALTTLRYHGDIRLRGTVNIKEAIEIGGCEYAEHAYNSWLQTALSFGIPALLLALYFTWLALRDSVLLLFFRDSSIGQKCTALLVLCLLAAGMLEPFLFAGYADHQYFNVLFFLCLGYLELWQEALRPAGK